MNDDSKVEINSSSDALALIGPVTQKTSTDKAIALAKWFEEQGINPSAWFKEHFPHLNYTFRQTKTGKDGKITIYDVEGNRALRAYQNSLDYRKRKQPSNNAKNRANVGEALAASQPKPSGGDKPLPYGDQEQTNNTGIPYKSPEVYSSPTTWDSNIYPVPPFHQTLLAHELTLRRASNDMRKLEASLSAAMVDLNPHQIDAALFAFKGPMSTGALLCDEVGLGKTIEAGLIISQLWAEGRRRIIAVVPATIRKQWQN